MDNYFTNIPRRDPSTTDMTNVAGNQYLNNVAELSVGFGSNVLHADKSGIWLGATKFADAPFSVDMFGNIIATTLTGQYLSKSGTGQNLTGSIYVGNNSVKIDGANNRIVINDGVTNRIAIGNV